MSDQIKVGIVGAGANTKARHIPGFQSIEGVSVEVVANRSEASSRKVCEEFGIPRIAKDWKAVVEDPEIQAVCIGTWPYLHAPVTVAALGEGKHVLTEARMAMNAAEAQKMLEAAQASQGLVAQVVPSPFTLKWDRTIREIIESGELGELLEAHFVKSLSMNADAHAPLNWRQDIEYSGNNIMMLGIYYEVAQRWLRQEPKRVWASGKIVTDRRLDPETGELKEVKIPETLSMVADYDSGIRLTGSMSGLEIGAARDEMVVNGSQGSLRLDLQEGVLYRSTLDRGREAVEVPAEKQGAWRVELDFIESIRSGKPVTLTSFEDGLAYMRVTDAVAQSIRQGGVWLDL